ncbi:MAG TPA: POTRA domain-containing protein [Candidatus Acidoferrales bacterium]|nr:POTRA domain-containing protein [Candidatus Acidoferrales bacterium]
MLFMQARFFSRRILAPLTLAAFASSLPVPAPAQATDVAANGKLESVRVTGSVRFQSDQIAPSTGLTPGATITKDDLQRGADRLAQLGPFATVQYRYATLDTGVQAEYQVTDAPALPVWFDNFAWFSDDELKAALKKAVPLFDGTAPEHGTVLDDMSDALVKLLETRGVHATVSHALASAPTSDERIQEFRVEGAAELSVASVEFTDALARSDRALQQRLADVVGQPYSRTLIDLFEFEQVRPLYLSHAFLRAKLGVPRPRIEGGPGNFRVSVVIPIEPGLPYAWNGVTWIGNSALTSAELNGLAAGLRSGDPADGMKIDTYWEAVRDAYGRRGYLDVKLVAKPEFEEFSKRVAYSVSLTEGTQYHMGKLVLTGLSIEGERRIRAAWGIASGAVFDKSFYEEFYANGIKQAFVGLPFHYDKIGRFLQEDQPAATVDVLLDFQ